MCIYYLLNERGGRKRGENNFKCVVAKGQQYSMAGNNEGVGGVERTRRELVNASQGFFSTSTESRRNNLIPVLVFLSLSTATT